MTKKSDRKLASIAIEGVRAGLTGIVALVAFVGGGSLFDLFPNLQPATSRSVTIEALTIEPSVAMEQYAEHSTFVRGTRSYSSDAGSCSQILDESGLWKVDPQRAKEPGIALQTVVDFSGFLGRCLVVEPLAFETDSGIRMPVVFDMYAAIRTDKRDTDQAGVEIWVSQKLLSEPFSFRVQVFEGDVGHLLTFMDSPSICPPGFLPCPAASKEAPDASGSQTSPTP